MSRLLGFSQTLSRVRFVSEGRKLRSLIQTELNEAIGGIGQLQIQRHFGQCEKLSVRKAQGSREIRLRLPQTTLSLNEK